jgi:beta-galactosidase
VIKTLLTRFRALVYLDGHYQGSAYRDRENTVPIREFSKGAQLDILVENMGRINFGPSMMGEHKGVTQGIALEYQYLFNWTMFTLPLDYEYLQGKENQLFKMFDFS